MLPLRPGFNNIHMFCFCKNERCGLVVEFLSRDLRAVGSSLAVVTVLCPRARLIYPCLVLVQPRKTRPDVTEILLTGM